jgi:hypothetical protein
MLSNPMSETEARVAIAQAGVQLSPCCVVLGGSYGRAGRSRRLSQSRVPHSLSQPVFGASVTFFMNA